MRVLHSDLITAGRLRLQPGPGGEENTGEVPGLRAKPALRLCGERSAVTPVSYPPVSFCKKHNLLSLSLSLSDLTRLREMENLILDNFSVI